TTQRWHDRRDGTRARDARVTRASLAPFRDRFWHLEIENHRGVILIAENFHVDVDDALTVDRLRVPDVTPRINSFCLEINSSALGQVGRASGNGRAGFGQRCRARYRALTALRNSWM